MSAALAKALRAMIDAEAHDTSCRIATPGRGCDCGAAAHRAEARANALRVIAAAPEGGLERAVAGFLWWADERIRYGMIFPEELSVRLDDLRPEPKATRP